MNDPMPKGGVKELLKSSDGRRYLKHLQKKYHNDIVQPHLEPKLFNQLYGSKIQRDKQIRANQESQAKEEWERSNYEKNRGKGKRKIFI